MLTAGALPSQRQLLWIASGRDNKIAWYENTDGQGSFGAQQVITTAADGAHSVFAADLDGDDDMDVLSASSNDNKIAWYRNRSNPSTSVATEDRGHPKTFKLSQNYPNPFNPETVIGFHLPETRNVILKIYNILGEEIRSLVDAKFTSGIHNVQWNGKDNNGNSVSSGIYFYQLQAGSFAQVRKMTLLR